MVAGSRSQVLATLGPERSFSSTFNVFIEIRWRYPYFAEHVNEKRHRQDISMREDERTMPASVQRHNLARLRQEMALTQSDLAALIMRSPATIKAVEIGKLPLSENLAALVSEVTGADKKWLLENNLSTPVPALRRVSSSWVPKDRAYVSTCHLLVDLFSRLFAVCRRLREGEGRQNLLTYIKDELELLEKTSYEPDAIQRYRASVGVFEFFEMHPQLLDPDLRQLINLPFLAKDAYEAQRLGKEAFSKAAKKVRKLENQSNLSSHDGVLSAPGSSASGIRSPKRRKGPRPSRKSS
jgi:transcriptional regulator with XRE-family HTH domain